MNDSGGIRASLAGRYASALFGLAEEENKVDKVASDMESLRATLADSEDLEAFIESPAIGRDEAARTVRSIADKFGLDRLTGNFLGVLAENGRLDQLGDALRAFETLVAEYKNIAKASVTSARPLSESQLTALKDKLSAHAGRTVQLETSVDPHLLGGIRVKLGSELIDASVRTRLNSLAQKMGGQAR